MSVVVRPGRRAAGVAYDRMGGVPSANSLVTGFSLLWVTTLESPATAVDGITMRGVPQGINRPRRARETASCRVFVPSFAAALRK